MTAEEALRIMNTAIVVAALLSGCATTPDLPQCAVPLEASDGYMLSAGDRIQLDVYRHADLSGEFVIDRSGIIAVPLLGRVSAVGSTSEDLAAKIGAAFRDEGYLTAASVGVQLLEGAPVFVLGEVNGAQEVPYTDGMTVLQLVARSGGYTYRADQGSTMITRDGCWAWGGPSTELKPGDVVQVSERLF